MKRSLIVVLTGAALAAPLLAYTAGMHQSRHIEQQSSSTGLTLAQMGPGSGQGMGPGMMGQGMGPGMMGQGMGPGMMGQGVGPGMMGQGMGPGMMGQGMGHGMMGQGMGHGMMGQGMGPGMMGGMMSPGMMGQGMGPRMMGQGMGPGMMQNFGVPGDVQLSPEQRAEIAEIQQEVHRKQWDLMAKMHDQQFHMQMMMTGGAKDDAAARKAYETMAQSHKAMFEAMLDARKRIAAVIEKSQPKAKK